MEVLKQILGFSSKPVDPRSIGIPLIQTYAEWLEQNPNGYVCDEDNP